MAGSWAPEVNGENIPLAAGEQEVEDENVSVERNSKGPGEFLPILSEYYCHLLFSLSSAHPKTGMDT